MKVSEYRQLLQKKPPKANKYRNKKTGIDGITFDSKKEAEHYVLLCLRAIGGEISELKRQVKFEVIPKFANSRAKHYIADFTYIDKHGKFHVVDVKGVQTETFKLKRALMLEKHGIEVEVV